MPPRKISETGNIPNGITVEFHVVGPGGQVRIFTITFPSEYKAMGHFLILDARPNESAPDMTAAILSAILDAVRGWVVASQAIEQPPAMSRSEAAVLLRQTLDDFGLKTVRAAADLIGISETHLARILKAERRITEEIDRRLACILGRPRGAWITT